MPAGKAAPKAWRGWPTGWLTVWERRGFFALLDMCAVRGLSVVGSVLWLGRVWVGGCAPCREPALQFLAVCECCFHRKKLERGTWNGNGASGPGRRRVCAAHRQVGLEESIMPSPVGWGGSPDARPGLGEGPSVRVTVVCALRHTVAHSDVQWTLVALRMG